MCVFGLERSQLGVVYLFIYYYFLFIYFWGGAVGVGVAGWAWPGGGKFFVCGKIPLRLTPSGHPNLFIYGPQV